ncbi:MAG: hypothetical protein ACREVX_02525 [Clostridium sp.]|uniref:hypothetical protein n=1 Tax=Clostridium sp. TaxID=1506 RepID=UPI003D6D2490
MKFKNKLLMLPLLTIFFVGCARQAPVMPKVTPPRTDMETRNVVPGTEYPDTTVKQGTATGAGTDMGEKNGTSTGIGTDAGAKYSTSTGVGTDTGAKTGAAIGEDTGNRVGTGTETGTKTESKVSTGNSLQHGTYNGDLYVSTKNFRLIDTRVNGNVYFTSNEVKSTFTMDATSKVTGRQELRK